MTPRDDWGAGRTTGGGSRPRQPPPPPEEELARWRALGREKFRDPAYQRYAQNWRSEASLQESGKAGYQALVGKYGRDFAANVLARSRHEHPTAPERAMIGLLDELGQREGADYFREYRVAPGVYADFAWPERKLAVEVHGSAHDAAFFLARGMAEREARRLVVYEDAGWTVRVVTDHDLVAGREQTIARVREALTKPEQRRLW